MIRATRSKYSVTPICEIEGRFARADEVIE